ncbi:NAD-binding protein [Candidatus Chloroploca asiatica]|uniref:RCK N-terminal domain-containing protein n=1 Tax=Candidatus Chloroploca asiatica TaxID=1506545 RepID=A0A2H3KT96_9CHLR|nr:NAD-binding protein [Candidatus Chloroploca asiatica]PDV98504.1 hypothetical protein A9Q02_15040 [Candidatus Chloroploca asiatica]
MLDIDSDRVDLLRKLGLKVYYGDASRYDLLASAGAGHAKILVIALDTPEKTMALSPISSSCCWPISPMPTSTAMPAGIPTRCAKRYASKPG